MQRSYDESRSSRLLPLSDATKRRDKPSRTLKLTLNRALNKLILTSGTQPETGGLIVRCYLVPRGQSLLSSHVPELTRFLALRERRGKA